MTPPSENQDAPYFVDGQGISSVPIDRWRTAQDAERKLWVEDGLWWDNDRNDLHKNYFDNYELLKGRYFEHALEIGCGPFTNVRLIAQQTQLKKVSLLDPLCASYLTHPSCRYTNRRLIIDTWPTFFQKAVLVRINRMAPALTKTFRSLLSLGSKSVPVCNLISQPAETLSIVNEFDLIVWINVLEHCFDAQQIFQRVKDALRPRSLLIFHERLYEEAAPLPYFDPYHPLRVSRRVTEEFLKNFFTPLLWKVIDPSPEQGEHWPQLYAILEKK